MTKAARSAMVVALLLAALGACETGGSGTPSITLDGRDAMDTASDGDVGGDAAGGDAAGGDAAADDAAGGDGVSVEDPGPGDGICPGGHVTLTFQVDDRANGTYAQGELIWTGSFAYDEATNTLVYATSWLPEEGPYPELYDDGPHSTGGHEPEGATAGDHIWGTAVCFRAEKTQKFAYGLLNEDLRWIWIGPNGQFEITAGATGVMDIPGMTIAAHGDVDLELTLDVAEINADYATIDFGTRDVFVKGTMNAWTPIQLLDDGNLADAVAGDGVYTYRHSLSLGAHDGLLAEGQEAQFVFVFAKRDTDPDEGQEYKDVNGDAMPDGVGAALGCGGGWKDVDVVLSLDSKGVSNNTAVVADCGGFVPPTECSEEEPCESPDDECVEGKCVPKPECDEDNPCPSADDECVEGTCVPKPECSDAEPCASADEHCVDGQCVLKPECGEENPCPSADDHCVAGKCVLKPECDEDSPCASAEEHCVSGKCVPLADQQPEIYLIVPSTGSALGNTEVRVIGAYFAEGATVLFDGAEATPVTFDASELTVTTPAHAEGPVDVEVLLTSGLSALYPNGFTYVETANAPVIDAIVPNQGPSAGGTVVTVGGASFAADAVVRFGTKTGLDTVVAAGGTSITTTTPAAPLGAVDVRVVNGDGQSALEPSGFTYVADTADWAKLEGPATLETVAGKLSAPLTAQVFEDGVTPGDGPGFSITAEVGWGPADQDPSAAAETWTWTAATYREEVGNNDLYSGRVAPPEGSWRATMRFSANDGVSWLYADLDGSDNGFQLEGTATVSVGAAPPVYIAAITPDTLPVFGGPVALSGAGFEAGCTLTIDGAEVSYQLASETELTAVAPSHAAGGVEVAISCPEGSDADTLTYQESWDGYLGEWPESARLATSDVTTNWGAGENELHALYAAADGANLYVAVDGFANGGEFGANGVVVYIDTDFGGGTGLTDTDGLDTDGAVESALGGTLTFDIAGFGAEAAFATLNMSSYLPGVDDPAAKEAGWRLLSPVDNADNLPWLLDGAVIAGASGIEAWIPLSELYGAATGSARTLGIVVRITNADGGALANQSLPVGVSGAGDTTSTAAATLELSY